MFEQVGCNLLVLYSEHNLETISLPICNYGVPAQRPLEEAINKTIGYARLNHNTLIHCSAGIGRTAFFAAFLSCPPSYDHSRAPSSQDICLSTMLFDGFSFVRQMTEVISCSWSLRLLKTVIQQGCKESGRRGGVDNYFEVDGQLRTNCGLLSAAVI